jgi:carbamoyl-phosphate synthase small subunit
MLVLEDGSHFLGYPFGADVEAEGEIVFNTGMTGYQEICSDPSYHGQMVVLTYPLIGNYGVAGLDDQSRRPWVAALIVREYYDDYSNWRAEGSLHRYLAEQGVPGLSGIDTRALTRRLRNKGTMRAVLARWSDGSRLEELVARAQAVVTLSEKDLVGEASLTERADLVPLTERGGRPLRIVLVDCGFKSNIASSLRRRGLDVTVVPYTASVADVWTLDPQGVVLSNGPGDPAVLQGVVGLARELIGVRLPLLGICLGHQVLGQAIGATTSRLKFGHHGSNHPVKDLITGRVHITSQNHEFQVDAATVPTHSGFAISHINLNDGSVEGLAHREWPVFSVQYHPEGAPGPQDNQYVFDRFLELVTRELGG